MTCQIVCLGKAGYKWRIRKGKHGCLEGIHEYPTITQAANGLASYLRKWNQPKQTMTRKVLWKGSHEPSNN